MINITMNTKGAVDHQTISGINSAYTHGAVSAQNIQSLNTRRPSGHPGAGMPRTNSPVCAPVSAPFPDRTPVQAQPAANPPRKHRRFQTPRSRHRLRARSCKIFRPCSIRCRRDRKPLFPHPDR